MKSIKNNNQTNVLAISIILLALSLIFGYIEAILPINIGQVGIKIGLGNIVTLIGLKILTIKRTFFVNLVRLIILGLVFGNLIRFAISVSGFLLSFIVMCIAIKCLNFSILGSSILGGVSHNIGQIIAVTIILKNKFVFSLIPVYIIIGILTGAFIGVISSIIYKKISKYNF